MGERICKVEDCESAAHARDWCNMHYRRWRTHGDPLIVKIGAVAPGEQHFRWSGEVVTYRTAHQRVRKAKGDATNHPCRACGEPAQQWAYDHNAPDEKWTPRCGPYSADPEHYIPLCGACHRIFDAAYRGRPPAERGA